MRQSLATLLAVILGLGWVGSARADDADKARAIIDKAIKAVGGAEKLAKYKGATFKDEGTYYGMGDGIPYKGTYATQGPDQFRMEIENAFIMVLNRDKGWTKMGGETKAMTKEQLASQQRSRRAEWIATLVPLIKDKSFKLETLDEIKVDDKPAVGVKVTGKGYPEVKLYFDKKTGLRVKSVYRNKVQEKKFKEAEEEIYYKDYKEVKGIQVPQKFVMKRDGKLFVDAKIKDWTPKEKLDDKEFAKP